MKFSHICIIGLLASQSACTNLYKINHTSVNDNNFQDALAREYRTFANKEAKSYDWFDSDFFARKAIRASEGGATHPEDIHRNINRWKLSANKQQELLWSFDRLMKLLHNPKLREKEPAQLAKAQRGYDCWLEEEEEAWQPDEISACKSDFLSAVAYLENKLTIPEKQSKKPLQPVYDKSKVHFKFDSSTLDEKAQETISKTLEKLKELEEYKVELGGHTDTAGPKKYNQTLSEKRNKAVADKLIEGGAETKRIHQKGFGETVPAVPTDDNVPNQENRRVEINVKGYK